MKYNLKKIIISFFAVILIAGVFAYSKLGNSVQEETELNRFVYPTEFESGIFVTPAQKKAQCRIPEEILSDMTVEELVWAVIDYPFLWEEGLSSMGPGGGSQWINGISDAFRKLTECDDPEDKIIKVLKDAWERKDPSLFQVYEACRVFYDSQGVYFDFSKKQLKFLNKK